MSSDDDEAAPFNFSVPEITVASETAKAAVAALIDKLRFYQEQLPEESAILENGPHLAATLSFIAATLERDGDRQDLLGQALAFRARLDDLT